MELLAQTVEKIDLLQAQEKNFQQIIQNCEKLAHVCYTRLHDAQKHQAGTVPRGDNYLLRRKPAGKNFAGR